MQSFNPATGAPLKLYAGHDAQQVEARLANVHREAQLWRRTEHAHRACVLRRIAELLESQNKELARQITQEMGKPITQAAAEVTKCADVCRFFAERGLAMLAPESVAVEGAEAYVSYQPLGTVLAILPWNFPLWQAFRFIAPALMAGNAVVMKPAPNVFGCALATEQLLEEAGVPKGLVPNLLVHTWQIEAVIRDQRISAVTLTGSDAAGRAVAQIAGSELKKVVLELGGSDPYVVLADADLSLAVRETVRSRLVNAGQSCIGAKRCIVVDEVAERFEAMLLTALHDTKVADPARSTTQLGPLARADLRDLLHDQVERSVRAGAVCRRGGTMSTEPGFWYPLTVLTDVPTDSAAFREEMFGPVFSVTRAANDAVALRMANESPFGLGAAVFTQDVERGRVIAETELEAGCCFVNAFVRSDPRLPFGGIKASGYGRELSRHGLMEFVNVKTIWIGD